MQQRSKAQRAYLMARSTSWPPHLSASHVACRETQPPILAEQRSNTLDYRNTAVKRITCDPAAARAKASCAEKVDLPTPPLPDSTRILCRICRMRSSMAATSAPDRARCHLLPGNTQHAATTMVYGRPTLSTVSGANAARIAEFCGNKPIHDRLFRCSPGSGPLGAVAHASWLGHPAQLAALPASSLSVPTHSA